MVVSSILLLVATAAVTYGQNSSFGLAVDFSGLATKYDYIKLRNASYDLAFVRVYRPEFKGLVDVNGCMNIRIGADLGMKMEVYITPPSYSANKAAEDVANETIDAMTNCNVVVKTVWLQVVNRAFWSSDVNANVDYIHAFENHIQAISPNTAVGIYTNSADWISITNNSRDFNDLNGDNQLWYADVTKGGVSGETAKNIDDTIDFGGWLGADVKQFAQNEGLTGFSVKPLNRNIYKKSKPLTAFSRLRPLTRGGSTGFVVGGNI